MDRYELYYNYAHSQIQEQNERKKSIEVKARGFITLSIALFVVAGIVSTDFTSNRTVIDGANSLPLWLTLAFAMLSMSLSFLALYIVQWHIMPPLKELQLHIHNPACTSEQLAEWIADSMVQAYILNEDILMDKSDKLRWALITLYIEGAALGVLILTVVWR